MEIFTDRGFLKAGGFSGTVVWLAVLVLFLAFGTLACGKKAPPQLLDIGLKTHTVENGSG